MSTHILYCIFVIAIGSAKGYKPPFEALMARYILHYSDWVSVATISTMNGFKGYPFSNIKSVADGPFEYSTGIPYFLITDMDGTGKDTSVDNRISIMGTLANTHCKERGLNAQDPRCARLLMSGKLVKVPENTEEHDFAVKSLITRHPPMEQWLKGHKFYVAKMLIEVVGVLTNIGQGVRYASIEDYYKVQTSMFYQN